VVANEVGLEMNRAWAAEPDASAHFVCWANCEIVRDLDIARAHLAALR
jgi:hypothetical protein